MLIEQTEERGNWAYRFSKWEKQAIAKGLLTQVKKRKKALERMEKNPKNEDKAKYIHMHQMAELRAEIEILSETIEEFGCK